MAMYLVVHTPKTDEERDAETDVRPPTRLAEMARELGPDNSNPCWLKTWSPDLHDDRLFSLWRADDADSILNAIETYGFLDEMTAQPLRVQEWGPAEVLESHG
jgi:hypothetical protein